ncbi:MAG: hypothetical protein KKC51_15425 [Verrucomicrobia bacterium]|nr:hypothetical protein [Verrucomicrobiota bacterium]
MKKILMVLTSHRLDCFKLCMDLLVRGGSIRFFDRVVLLLNGVAGRHLRYVQALKTDHPDVPWDTIAGPRGRGLLVSNLQNECVRRYPDSLYFKIDEDTFVSADWPQKLLAAYEAHRQDPARSLITPVIPNNGLGCHYLLTAFPELAAEYKQRFNAPLTPAVDGPVWINGRIAEWITRKFLNLDEANGRLCARPAPTFQKFARRFSINCVCYDYRHWQEIGGVPEHDEIGWGDWIVEHGKFAVLVTDALVHHYSFFVQQDWLDRTPLLEDLRRANLPATLSAKSLAGYHLPRWVRIGRQLPHVLKRRLGRLFRAP